MKSITALCLGLSLVLTSTAGAEDGARAIFDGRSFDGWSAPDMSFWSIEDGAIVARSSEENPCKKNQFLVWQLGALDDFELSLEFQISGHASANSGIQIRSQIGADGHAVGYQADLDIAGTWRGALYDEHTGRRVLARPGETVTIAPDGTRKASRPETAQAAVFHRDGWNSYRIAARGSRITIHVNDTLTADVTDNETAHRDLSGKLALQLHSGPPCTVKFRKIRLRRLPLSEGRKKIVLLAGAPSHPCGQHEFNAGVKILARRLAAVDSVIAAPYHDGGWPKDPTAFDNADAIVIYADGLGKHPVKRHFEELDRILSRGVGLMCMHYAVHVEPGSEGDAFKKWIGGHYETDWSSNPHWDAALQLEKGHPIVNGVQARTIHDEWYFNMRFREGMKGVTSIVRASPSDKTRSMNNWPRKRYPHIVAASGRLETLMWAVERPDGGRGIGFTGGHWHRNWALDAQRRLILNATLWVAGAKVPTDGVDSAPVTVEELNENLDKKRKMVRVELPE